MKITYESLTTELANKQIKPSYQRIKVLEYLMSYHCHPTVEQIYANVHKDIPTLSKATVYNTLKCFIEADLVRVITIEDNETRYDINTRDHGHFKCDTCGCIHDFNINIDAFISEDLKGFKIKDKGVYFKGVCPTCINKK